MKALKFTDKTWNIIFDSVFLMMLLFFPALEGYVFKVLTIILPVIKKPGAEYIFSVIFWGLLVLATIPFWIKRLKRKHVIIFCGLFLFAFITYLLERDNPETAYTTERFTRLYLALMPSFFYGASMQVSKEVKKIVYYGAIFTFVVSVLYYFYKSLQVEMSEDNMDFAYKLLPAVLVLVSALFEKNKLSTILLRSALVLFAFIFLVMQGTRGPVLCVAIYAVLVSFKYFGLKKTLYVTLSILALGLFILYTSVGHAIVRLFLDLFNELGVSVRFLELILNESLADGASRNDLASYLLGLMKENPFAIRGFFADIVATRNFQYSTGKVMLYGTYAHNIYVELIFQFGIIVGLLLCILLTYNLIKLYVNSKGLYAVFVSVFIVNGFVHLLLSGSYLNNPHFYVLLGLFFNETIAKKQANNEVDVEASSLEINNDKEVEEQSDKIRIAAINMTAGGSTGRIMLSIAEEARKQGCIVQTYSTTPFSLNYKKPTEAPLGHKYFGNYVDNALHYILVYFFGKNGSHSKFSTWLLIRDLKKFNPSILHLHNLHKYCINLPMLFNYVKKNNVKVVWTLQDCWAITGHCPHFDMIKCEKWKTGCYECPIHNEYPKSKKDTSKWQYEHKKAWFTGVNDMTLVPTSKWLANKVKESFMKDYPIRVINNGIDLSVFKPTNSDLREKYQLQNKYVVLCVADSWSLKKGIDDVIKLSKLLNDKFKMVVIGLDEDNIQTMPSNVIALPRTDSVEELVKWYSTADVFVNTTKEDTYPTVNMESLACGTPIVTYKTGGSPEIINDKTGVVVKKGSVNMLKDAVCNVCINKIIQRENCLERAKSFANEDKYEQYVELYNHIFKREKS